MALSGRKALNVLSDLKAVRLELPSTARLSTDTCNTINKLKGDPEKLTVFLATHQDNNKVQTSPHAGKIFV